MVKNSFTDILLNWEKMNQSKKIQRLQDLENMIARFQGRKPRKVLTKPQSEIMSILKNENREPEAYYCRSDSANIYVFDLKVPAMDAIKNIIHEGFHAYVDDFIKGSASVLKTYSKVDPERFLIEEENLPAIVDEFTGRGMMQLYDTSFAEEKLNYEEDSMYIMKLILDSIESPMDAMKFQTEFMMCVEYAVFNQTRAKRLEREYKTTYESVVTEALNKEPEEKVDMSKCGKFVSEIDPELKKLYEYVKRNYSELRSLQAGGGVLMNQGEKERRMEELYGFIAMAYKNHVLQVLKNKKKS